MGFVDDAPRVHLETTEQWRAWLEENHTRPTGVFVVSWRSVTGRPAIPYESLVEQSLCFGWVDGRTQRLDDERTMIWVSPRKRGSAWAATNKVRVERLLAAGLIAPAGLAVIEAARADGSWTILDAVERLEVPDDLLDALTLRPGAREIWEAFPKSVRRSHLEWLAFAKTAPTRERRIVEIVDRAAIGERARS